MLDNEPRVARESKYARKLRERAQGVRPSFEFVDRLYSEPREPHPIPIKIPVPNLVIAKVVYIPNHRAYALLDDPYGSKYYLPLHQLDPALAVQVNMEAEIRFVPKQVEKSRYLHASKILSIKNKTPAKRK